MFRQFSTCARRLNIVSDLYVAEVKAFKPTPLTAADAQSATKPWKLPQPAKLPSLEAENGLDEYTSAKVEVSGSSGEVQEYVADSWFVFPKDVEPGHGHH